MTDNQELGKELSKEKLEELKKKGVVVNKCRVSEGTINIEIVRG
jgi:hypothetical protein